MPKSKRKHSIYKSVDQIVCHTSSTTFYKFWKENRRHERALKKIYGQDKLHICQPEEVGSVSEVHPGKRLLVTFYRSLLSAIHFLLYASRLSLFFNLHCL